MRAAAWLIALVLAAAVAAGCGGDDEGSGAAGTGVDSGAGTTGDSTSGAASERKQISATVRAYLLALNARDGQRACALLSKNGRGVLVGLLPSDQSDTECPEAVERLARRWTRVTRFRIDQISSSGSRATARIASRRPAYESGVLLQKEGDGWRIAYPPAILEKVSGPPGVPLGKDEPGT